MDVKNFFEGAVVNLPPAATVATNASATMSFSREGFSRASIFINYGSHATTSAQFTTLKLMESDTVTSPTSMTAIAAFNGGTATSSTYGYVLPAATSSDGKGATIEFQVDLLKRKKYIGLIATPAQALFISALAKLSGSNESRDSASEKSSQRDYVTTNTTTCTKVVTG